MKKDLIFSPIMLVVGVLLFLFQLTGKPAHIAIAVLGIVVLAAYSAVSKKEWKIPALEVIMRVFYGIALITGIVVMNVQDVMALVMAHRISALIFVVLFIVLFVHKLVTKKRA